jgi:hypothetical protein
MVADSFAGMRRFCESPEMCLGRFAIRSQDGAAVVFFADTHLVGEHSGALSLDVKKVLLISPFVIPPGTPV